MGKSLFDAGSLSSESSALSDSAGSDSSEESDEELSKELRTGCLAHFVKYDTFLGIFVYNKNFSRLRRFLIFVGSFFVCMACVVHFDWLADKIYGCDLTTNGVTVHGIEYCEDPTPEILQNLLLYGLAAVTVFLWDLSMTYCVWTHRCELSDLRQRRFCCPLVCQLTGNFVLLFGLVIAAAAAFFGNSVYPNADMTTTLTRAGLVKLVTMGFTLLMGLLGYCFVLRFAKKDDRMDRSKVVAQRARKKARKIAKKNGKPPPPPPKGENNSLKRKLMRQLPGAGHFNWHNKLKGENEIAMMNKPARRYLRKKDELLVPVKDIKEAASGTLEKVKIPKPRGSHALPGSVDPETNPTKINFLDPVNGFGGRRPPPPPSRSSKTAPAPPPR